MTVLNTFSTLISKKLYRKWKTMQKIFLTSVIHKLNIFIMHIEKDLSIISSNWFKMANFDLSNEKMAEAIFHKFKRPRPLD